MHFRSESLRHFPSLRPESAHGRAGAVVAPVSPLAVDRTASIALTRSALRVGSGATETVEAMPRPN